MVADALSRLEMQDAKTPAQHIAYCMANMVRDEAALFPTENDVITMAECFQGTVESELEQFPMLPHLIAKEQAKDKILQKAVSRHPASLKQRSWRGQT